MKQNKNNKAFTLIELLIVIAIIAIIAAAVIISVNPGEQLAKARDATRERHVKALESAIYIYHLDNGVFPGEITSTLTEICNTNEVASNECGELVDLSNLDISIPVDPQGEVETSGTGYEVSLTSNRIKIGAPKAETSLVSTNISSEMANGGLLNYKTWEIGMGSVSGFSRNGSDDENYRILDNDPWGKETVVWEARPDDVWGADGGWNSSRYDIDSDKTYRFSTWVSRTVMGADGRFYLGLRGYNSNGNNIGVVRRDNGDAGTTNPYFWVSSGPPGAGLPEGEWVLVVGHVWPAGSGTGSNHSDSGRYLIDGTYIGGISRDYVWDHENTETLHRSYLYYTTDTSVRQHWAYPRLDVIDGTEPSIQDLLNGFDSKYN